jgi:hypothetical protein
MPEKEKRSYHMDTDALPGMKLTRGGRLTSQEHQAYLEWMERCGMDEHQRKNMVDRLINRLKGI